jgi:hypothetical protein
VSSAQFGKLALAAFVFVAGWLVIRSVVLTPSPPIGLSSAPHWLLEVMAVGLAGVLLASLWFFSMVSDLLGALRDFGSADMRGLFVEQLAATAILAVSLLLLGLCAWQLSS